MNRYIYPLLIICSIIVFADGYGQVLLPWTEGFEGVGSEKTFYSDNSTINGLPEWNYIELNFKGRLRFQANPLFVHSGSHAATMDRVTQDVDNRPIFNTVYWQNTNFLELELDLSDYRFSNDLELSFYHMHHGEETNPFLVENDYYDKVWARGSSSDKWVILVDWHGTQNSAGVWQQIANIDIDNILSSANPPQMVSSTFQIRFGQNGDAPATDLTSSDGRTYDDITISGTLCDNPLTFSTLALSSNEIELDWTHNPNSSDVLVAVNSIDAFGTPVNGNIYSPGNTISGGGTVLYYGQLTSFNHNSSINPSTNYYYKAWTYYSGQYSPGVIDSVLTPCDAIQSLPWTEDFENNGSIPACWRQEFLSSHNVDWKFVEGNIGNSHPSAAYSGSYNACFQDTRSGADQSRLISPPLDLTGLSPGTVILSFWHTQEAWLTDQDELSLYYKADAQDSWTLLQTWVTNINTWTQEAVLLPSTNSSTYWIAFTGDARYGRGICIDDVKVDGRVMATWTGDASKDWSNPSNWSIAKVPDAGTDVLIPSATNQNRKPEINNGDIANCFDLTIEANAHLYVPITNALTVHGTITNLANEAGLIVKSDENGTGSLINATNGVSGTVERYLTSRTWHFIGIPVESEIAGVFDLPPGQEDIYLKTHVESTNTWGDYIVAVNTPLILGRGYETWVGAHPGAMDVTVEFKGILNAGNYTTGINGFYDLQYTSGHGLNLISNPYPSAIEANLAEWNRTNVTNSVWTWDGAAAPGGSYTIGNYRFWNSRPENTSSGLGTLTGGIIPAMQGFFVLSTGANPVMTIPQNSRTHSDQAYYKDSSIPNYTLRLDVAGNVYQDALFVNFNEKATEGYDQELDLMKLYGLIEAPQFYSIIPNKTLSINSLPNYNESTIVPLGFSCGESGLFTINASGMESFEDGDNIFLEDLKEGISQNLKTQKVYSFRYDAGEDENRFQLHFGKKENGIAEHNSISVYSYGNEVYIQIPSMEDAYIKIFDVLGNEIIATSSHAQLVTIVQVSKNTGYYLVKVQTEKEILTSKIFINQ